MFSSMQQKWKLGGDVDTEILDVELGLGLGVRKRVRVRVRAA